MAIITIRHVAGLRVLQVDEFNADSTPEIFVGRDPAAHVRFDTDREGLVSRIHCKITRDPLNAGLFRILDLDSRNGTYVNRQRVTGFGRLNHNDLVQLGSGGPEFRFEIDPSPPDGPTLKEYAWIAPTSVAIPIPEHLAPSPVQEARVEPKARTTPDRVVLAGVAAFGLLALGGVALWSGLQKARHEQSESIQQNLRQLDEIKETIQKTPNAADDVARLEAQLKQADARSQSTLKTLAAAVSAQNSELEAMRRERLRQSPPPEVLASPPAPDASPSSFDTLLTNADTAIKEGRSVEGLELGNQMIAAAPERWEGYALAGIGARMSGKFETARRLLQKAVSLMPAERRPVFEGYLNELKEEAAK
jgi:pSer/pThr/pTyr-binding forkhead associated (FHA) protein